MVMLYTCQACKDGNHGECEGGHPAPEGNYGGSMCRCKCKGDPEYMQHLVKGTPAYYKRKYGVMKEEKFMGLEKFADRKETKIGDVFKVEDCPELNTLNKLAYVRADKQSPWGYVIELKTVWVEE